MDVMVMVYGSMRVMIWLAGRAQGRYKDAIVRVQPCLKGN